jgi:chromosome segregation ATPase
MQTEKLQKLEASYQAQLSRKLGETDQALENELNNLHKAFLNASEKLSKETAILCRDYEERGRDLFASTQDTMAEMENKIAGLDSRIESIDSEIGGKLEKQFVSVQEKMDAFTARQEDLYVMRVEELRKQFKEELDAAQIMCVSKLTEMQAGIDGKTQSIYLKLNKIYDDFSVDAMKFDNENRERYRGLLEKMEEAAEKVDTLKEELSLGMEERIKREFKIADELFVDKAQDMRENIQRMEVESKKQLDDYYKELMRVQDALDVIENDYAEMMQNKFASLDVQASEYLTQIKTALTESVTLINSKMSELSDKMKTVETSYTEKAEFMLFNQEQKWKEVEDKYSDFDEHVDAVYRRLPEAAKEMDEVVAIGKAKLEDAFYFQIEEQKRHFKEAEMQLDKKALSLNKKMQEMQRSIRDIDNRFAAEYLERSAVLDERIASIEFEISKFERNIMLVQKTGEMKDELEKEIAGLKNTVADVKADKNKMEALGQRMAELESSASERYEKLFAQSQSYEDLNLRIKDLQQEIESVEEKTQDLREMRLATQQLDAKFIVLERQFGRIDSMIGKIETSESIAKDYYQKLNEMRLNVTQLRQMMSTMESQWQEMEVKRKVYGEKIEHFESEADLILNSQSQINAVMTKFKQMDLLVEDLESRTDAVRHLQDWLIRAETRMENMKTDLQRVLPEEKPVVVEASDNL